MIEIRSLSKSYGKVAAVDGLTISIKKGEIFGLLGPNGAGKSTTLGMLSTLIAPTSGTALVNGYDITTQKSKVRESIGIVFQDQSLDDELTAKENMELHASLYHIPKKEREAKIIELLTLVELYDKRDGFVKTFSGGMKRRLEIARGLMHSPKALFLDEPTLGLDPQTRNHLWTYIKKLARDKSITIILTTHYMEEADLLCKTVAIMDNGKILAMGTPDALKQKIGGGIIKFTSNKKLSPDILRKLDGVISVKAGPEMIVHVDDAPKRIVEIVRHVEGIETASMWQPTLEDVFLHYTGKSIREEEGKPSDLMRLRRRIR